MKLRLNFTIVFVKNHYFLIFHNIKKKCVCLYSGVIAVFSFLCMYVISSEVNFSWEYVKLKYICFKGKAA